MSGTAQTNGADTANPIKEEGNQAPENGKEDHNNQESSQDDDANLLLSRIVPPSHILADGRFIRLPPPSALERSSFFERAVAVHHLISGDGEDEKKSSKTNNKRQKDDNDDGNNNDDEATRDGKRKKKSADTPFVHPLAIASARIRAKGMDELSKSINLGGLVIGGEYFGLTNIVNQRASGVAKKDTPDNTTPGEGKGKEVGGAVNPSAEGGAASSSDGAPANALDESILLDQRLRSKYVLRRRQSQYSSASTVLSRHEKRLVSSIAVMRILDARLRTLRKRWRLVAPEHGTRTEGPVRPREVVSVDVEVYDRDRLGGGSRATGGGGGSGDTINSALGMIARRVPRFATMELDDDYDVSVDILSLRRKIKDVVEGLKSMDDAKDGTSVASAVNMKMNSKPGEQSSSSSGSPAELSTLCKTKAEPFAIADPTLGKIDLDFDPDKVPLLTLLFEIEKPSTGFVERATLSSSFLSSNTDGGDATNSNGKRRGMHPDERVIEALQHSLFCASLFESMRGEIIPASSTHAASSMSNQQQRPKSVAWLSSEMEESFLPPPSVMAGEDTSQMLCVIHCHEGEVKVQLDDEYSLTVKLIEAGTAAAAGDSSSKDAGDSSVVTSQQEKIGDGGIVGVGSSPSSGSQSPAQLRTLCRALLLHSQSLYHEHCMETRIASLALEKKDVTPTKGFARTKKEVKAPSPHILQSCVSYGCKSIFEKKVRMVLKRLSRWLEKDMDCPDKFFVEWLPLALFDSQSRFVLLFRDQICIDVGIKGDVLRVTQTSGHAGEFRAVGFGSELELECFLKLEFRRALAHG